MDAQAIFGLQFFLSIVAWGVVARLMWSPWLRRQSTEDALFFLTLPHAFRHVGMVFLVPGVVDRPLPSAFAGPAAYGDLLTGVLAIGALLALKSGWKGKLALVWLANMVGTIDLLSALRHTDVAPLFGAAWYIPTFLVPLLLVTHFMSFARLLRRGPSRVEVPRAARTEAI